MFIQFVFSKSVVKSLVTLLNKHCKVAMTIIGCVSDLVQLCASFALLRYDFHGSMMISSHQTWRFSIIIIHPVCHSFILLNSGIVFGESAFVWRKRVSYLFV